MESTSPLCTTSREIYLDAPNLGKLEKAWLARAIDAGFVSTAGPFVPEFEARLAQRLGVPAAVATQSGTAALHVALQEAGVSVGDEVIVPALTFVATANVVTYVGARPVFVDADEATWTMDVSAVERCITERTRAIVPVHLYGIPCHMKEILSLAERHGLKVIEDATESLGTMLDDRHAGTLGHFGCLSFNGNKTITTGGGGMVLARDAAALRHVKFVINQARDESIGYYHPEIGHNYRMTNIEAALGLAQLERLDGFLERRRVLHRAYREGLGGLPRVRFQEAPPGAAVAHWITAVRFTETVDVASLQARLRDHGVPTRRLFMPIPGFPPYRDPSGAGYSTAEALYESGLCLPSSTLNTEDDVRFVCSLMRELLS